MKIPLDCAKIKYSGAADRRPSVRGGLAAMSAKEEFIELFQEHIHRDGAEALLDYLTNKCDFFTAPALQGSHFVGHYGKIVSNRMGVFFNAQIFKRSKT